MDWEGFVQQRPPGFSVSSGVIADDPIVESVRALLLKRSQLGIAKYGCDMTRTDLELIDWHQHRLEELLDAAVYTMRIIQQMRMELDDGK